MIRCRPLLTLALLLAGAARLGAQGGAPATPAPLPSPSPALTPPAVVVSPAPPPNAVALCADRSYAVAPDEPKACDSRGGVRLLLPGARKAPAAPAGRPVEVRVPSAAADAALGDPPAGATMRCKDGAWLSGVPSAGRCDRNGGLAVILPSPRPTSPPRTP